MNVARIVAHENVIDMVIPVLQQRGRYKTEYALGTFREKLFGGDARMPAEPMAGGFRR
ncbi:hypothetical protein GCM10023175_20290 [Pseudonocardia xishanensis]|uniref:Luciferase-like monooxygenase n=1 Tax=Pseudonocardia xishanensis TaxID=630995 RepID=A0ABP8RNV1_9PSEU